MTKSSKVCLTRLPTVSNAVLNSVVSLTPHAFTSAVQLLCYANEMNILRAFFPYNRFSRMFARIIKMIQICPTILKFGQYYFWKFLTTSLSGATLPLKDCGSLAFHENWGKSSCQDDFMNNLKDLNHEVSRTHWKCIIRRLWSPRELGTAQVYPYFSLTNRCGDITIDWWLGIKVVSRIN